MFKAATNSFSPQRQTSGWAQKSFDRHTVELIRVANVSQISATVVHREAAFGYRRVLTGLLCVISAGQ